MSCEEEVSGVSDGVVVPRHDDSVEEFAGGTLIPAVTRILTFLSTS